MEINWGELFAFNVSPIELIVRGTLIYWFIFILIRLAGRRGFGSVGTADILLLVLVADAADNAMSADYKSVGEGMVLISTLVFWSLLVDRLCYFFPTMRIFLEPSRLCLIKDGVIQRQGLRKEFLTEEELTAELRLKGVENIADVRRAYIEQTGSISVIRKSAE